MTLQTILYGTFLPPTVVRTHRHRLINAKPNETYAPSAKVCKHSRRGEVEEIMRNHPDGISTSELAVIMGRSKAAIYSALIKMTNAQLIKAKGSWGCKVEGKWCLK